ASIIGTNGFGSGGTNVFDVAGVTNNASNNRTDITNAIGSGFSNLVFNMTNPLPVALSGLGTNYDSAAAIAQSTVDGSGINGAVDTVNSIASSPPSAGSPGGLAVSIPIGERTMSASLMPGDWGGLWDVMSNLLKWFLVASYFTKLSIDSYK